MVPPLHSSDWDCTWLDLALHSRCWSCSIWTFPLGSLPMPCLRWGQECFQERLPCLGGEKVNNWGVARMDYSRMFVLPGYLMCWQLLRLVEISDRDVPDCTRPFGQKRSIFQLLDMSFAWIYDAYCYTIVNFIYRM